MTATPPKQRIAALLVVVALAGAACTSSGPNTLARAEETPAFTLPPVTTSPLGTVAPPTTSANSSTSTSSDQPDSTDTDDPPAEEVAPTGLELISSQLIPLLGPTESLSEAMNSIAPFPGSVPTPQSASIIEISIGAGTPSEDGSVIAQIGVTVRTSTSPSVAFAQMTGAVQAAGMFPIDSTEDETNRSAAFRVPGGDQFDEVVITATPDRDQTVLRVVSNAALPTAELAPYVNWAASRLPLPVGDRQRTLVVATASGEERLGTTVLSVESSVVVDGATAQREANRLIDRVQNSDVFASDADPEEEQPLTGSLRFDGLDSLQYWVSPVTRTVVNSDGELEEQQAIEIGLTGTTSQ